MIARLETGERGFTLIETLVAATMMAGVMGATLTTLAEFGETTRRADAQTDAQQEARRAVDALSQELRNLASPTNELPQAVEEATASDLVFLSVGAERPEGSLNTRNTVRVRYCLDAATATLWRQEQGWTTAAAPSIPDTTACPTAPTTGGWEAARVAATDARNDARAVFSFNAAELVDITEIRMKLWVDPDPARAPGETVLESVAFLRNQNRGPTASFTVAPSGGQILLNGSGSTDPEGKALEYLWYDNGVPDPVGEGIVFTYSPSEAGDHSIKLTVEDPAGLEHEAPPQDVCLVGGGHTCP
ncbi:MAG: PKD domain-containing protein [Thermoleophilaceae bacterium]